jgi:hypothetical protein
VTSPHPAISVILATDSYETIRPVVDCLRRQTVKAQIELVILGPDQEALGLDLSELDGFGNVQVIAVGAMNGFAGPRAVGIRAASAPIIVIGETHSYPHPGWAEALIEAHNQAWAVVVPGFGNANSYGSLSWAAFLRDYGCWLAGLPAGEIHMMPTHNVAYKRAVLLELGSELERALAHGDQLNQYLRAHGYRMYFQPAARIDHLNVSRPGAWLDERFLFGLLLAAQRSRRWTWQRRLLYLAGSPLIPAVILSRARRGLSQARRQAHLPRGTALGLVLGAVVSTAGEVVGYVRGAGSGAAQKMTEYELHKARYVVRPRHHATEPRREEHAPA